MQMYTQKQAIDFLAEDFNYSVFYYFTKDASFRNHLDSLIVTEESKLGPVSI